jgi:alpha,alpha-trehalase
VAEGVYLNKYDSNQTTPRPESYKEDLHLHQKYPERKDSDLYINIGAGCESGMDFSTRWFEKKDCFGTIEANKIAAVDLNAFLYMNEKIL